MKCEYCGKCFSPKVYRIHRDYCKNEEDGHSLKMFNELNVKFDDSLKVEQLKDFARWLGLTGYSKMNQSELIEVINKEV